jgi:3-dehydroquinate synthase
MKDLRFFDAFQTLPRTGNTRQIAIYDGALLKSYRIPGFKTWLSQFDLLLTVQSGEALKSTKELERIGKKLLNTKTAWPRNQTEIVAIGGGSIGDFAGFFASIFQRGVALSHVPTTWLAAIDSAHGGKTALNLAGVKNVIGTFYPAKSTYLFFPFFMGSTPQRLREGCGEAAKMALLSPQLWKRARGPWDPISLWHLLPTLIHQKLKIVAQDPFDKSGKRAVLNLGHTSGHALESYFKIPHGEAVGMGLYFANWVSFCEGWISPKVYFEINNGLKERWDLIEADTFPPRNSLRKLILRDKKVASNTEITFVGLSGIGRPKVVKLSIEKLLDYAESYCS